MIKVISKVNVTTTRSKASGLKNCEKLPALVVEERVGGGMVSLRKGKKEGLGIENPRRKLLESKR